MIEKSLLILAQAVVVLVVGRGKRRAHRVELRIGGTAVAGQFCRAVLVIGNCLRPAGHLQQLFALGRAQGNVRAGSGAVEVIWQCRSASEPAAGREADRGPPWPQCAPTGKHRPAPSGWRSSHRLRARPQSRSPARPVPARASGSASRAEYWAHRAPERSSRPCGRVPAAGRAIGQATPVTGKNNSGKMPQRRLKTFASKTPQTVASD